MGAGRVLARNKASLVVRFHRFSCDPQVVFARWPHRAARKTFARSMPMLVPSLSRSPRYLYKVRRLTFGKGIQNQSLTKSVLNARSREVQRQKAGERQFRVSAGAPQSGGFRAEPVVIGLLCALNSPQRMLVAEGLAEGEQLYSNILRRNCD